MPHDPDDDDQNGVRIRYPTWLDNYFVPRGYAVAFVDWLNGRAKARYQNGAAAVADWTDGSTGIIGTSWNGTIANAAVVQREDGSFTTEQTWPVSGVHKAQLAFGQPWDGAAGSLTVGGEPGEGSVSVTGDGRRTTDQVTTHPTDPRDGRIVFLTNKLSSDLRLSGTPRVTLRLNVDEPAAAVKVRLVDYGKASRYAGMVPTDTTTCWGARTPTTTAATTTPPSPPRRPRTASSPGPSRTSGTTSRCASCSRSIPAPGTTCRSS